VVELRESAVSHQWRLALVSLFLCKLLRLLPEIAAASGTRFWNEPNLCFTPDWYCQFIDTVTTHRRRGLG